jgi:ribosomal protein L11 methyltransferase
LPHWFPGSARPQFDVASVPDTDWAENWKEHFPPLLIGERLYVHPPWVQQVPPERIGVVIDPGMAFGTGHHASTRSSLLLLDRIAHTERIARVLDLGTGSGVLAIAAAKLGATEVCGVDIDADACAVAHANAATNGVAAQVRVIGSLDGVAGQFDVVLANLLADQLIELAPRLATAARRNGCVIGAGILSGADEDVARAWEAARLHVIDRHREDEWVAILARRR